MDKVPKIDQYDCCVLVHSTKPLHRDALSRRNALLYSLAGNALTADLALAASNLSMTATTARARVAKRVSKGFKQTGRATGTHLS